MINCQVSIYLTRILPATDQQKRRDIVTVLLSMIWPASLLTVKLSILCWIPRKGERGGNGELSTFCLEPGLSHIVTCKPSLAPWHSRDTLVTHLTYSRCHETWEPFLVTPSHIYIIDFEIDMIQDSSSVQYSISRMLKKNHFQYETSNTEPRSRRIRTRVDMRHGMGSQNCSHITVAIKISVKRHTPTSHQNILPCNNDSWMLLNGYGIKERFSNSENNLVFHSEKKSSDILSPSMGRN